MSALAALFRKIPAIIMLSYFLLLTQAQPGSAGEIAPEFRSDIDRLLKMTGAEALGLQVGVAISNQIIDTLSRKNPEIPPKAIEAIKDEIGQVFAEEMPKLMAEIVPIYAKNFTHEDIKGLIAFYSTPLGQKSIKVMPTVVNECMQAGQAWGQGLGPKLLPRLESRLKREGIDL